jgi:hypothetical protein
MPWTDLAATKTPDRFGLLLQHRLRDGPQDSNGQKNAGRRTRVIACRSRSHALTNFSDGRLRSARSNTTRFQIIASQEPREKGLDPRRIVSEKARIVNRRRQWVCQFRIGESRSRGNVPPGAATSTTYHAGG